MFCAYLFFCLEPRPVAKSTLILDVKPVCLNLRLQLLYNIVHSHLWLAVRKSTVVTNYWNRDKSAWSRRTEYTGLQGSFLIISILIELSFSYLCQILSFKSTRNYQSVLLIDLFLLDLQIQRVESKASIAN